MSDRKACVFIHTKYIPTLIHTCIASYNYLHSYSA